MVFKSLLKKTSNVAGTSSSFLKTASKNSGNVLSFAKRNKKKIIAGTGAAGAAGLVGYSAIDAGLSGSNFVDKLTDNTNSVIDTTLDAAADVVESAAGGVIDVVGKMIGLDQDTIDFLKENSKNIMIGFFMLFLYMNFGIIGIIMGIVLYYGYQNKDTEFMINLQNQAKNLMNNINNTGVEQLRPF